MLNTMLYKVFILLMTGLSLTLFSCLPAKAVDIPKGTAKITPDYRVVVYYLHNTFRCSSCNSIGDLTQAAVPDLQNLNHVPLNDKFAGRIENNGKKC